jgi:hypothetical protein
VYPSAGQNRDESGVDLIDQTQGPIAVDPELELGVGQDDPRFSA